MGLSATVEEGETLTDEGRGMVEEIRQNAQWLLHLSENILSVTRFSEEGVVIEKSDEVVEEIVGSAIRAFAKTAPRTSPSRSRSRRRSCSCRWTPRSLSRCC